MFNPDVDDSEPLNPGEDGSGYYNKLADSPELGRYNEGLITANKGFTDEQDKRATLLTKTPTKQNVEIVEEQFSKKGTPKRRTQKTPSKLRFNVTETQPSPATKKSHTTKHTRSASTGQQYIQPSPPPSPKFKHPYQQLKGGDIMDDSAEKSTGYINISVDGSPRLNNNVDMSKVSSSDSPVHVDMTSPVSSFFKEALQSTPLTKQSGPSIGAVNPSFTVANSSNSVLTEAPVSMVTAHGTSHIWGVSPQKLVQQENNNAAPISEWIVSNELREKFTAQFRDLKPENGLLYGDKARVFFLKSKLQSKDLSMIWKLADVDRDGKLSEEEFCIAMKMVLVRRKGYDIPSTIPDPLLPSKPPVAPLLPHSTFQTTTVADDAMVTTHLPALPTLQQAQLKSHTLPVGMKPVTSSKFPTQLPLLPPPSRKQFTRTNTGGTVDSPVRINGNDELVNSPTDQGSSRATGLLHTNWPSTLTSDSGKPLKFDSNIMESTVPLPPTPTDAHCPIDNNMEKNQHVAIGNNKHKTSGPPAIDLGPKPVQLLSSEPAVKQLTEAPVKGKSKKAVVPVTKEDSNDEETFDSDEDETSALYAVVKPRGSKGKGEAKTHKHSTLRSSNSFKKHKPRPPPKPEPYSVSKYKKKSSSPTPVDMATTAAVESGHVDASGQELQDVSATSNATSITTTSGDQARVEIKESSINVDDPSALYAKVIKKKPSMDLMEPIPLGQDVVPLEQVSENNTALPSIAIEKEDETKANTSVTSDSSSEMTSATMMSNNITDTLDTTDGNNPVQLISVTRVESDSTTATTTAANRGSEAKPIPMPRKKHHRSSSLDLNKMFQKRKSAEQLAISPDSLTKDLPSAVPPKPPPKPRKPKPVANIENELMPQISRSASLDSINSAAGNTVHAHRDLFEKNIPVPRTPPVLEQLGTQHDNLHKKKKPLLPPHLRSNQPSDTQITSSSDSGHYDLVVTSNSQEYTEKRDKAEIQRNIKSLREETKALMQLNHNLQQMLMRLMEERTSLTAKLESSTKHHTSS